MTYFHIRRSELIKLKSLVIEAVKKNPTDLIDNQTYRYGFLEVIRKNNTLIVAYGGNMGNGMREVDNCLKGLGLPSTKILKKNYKVVKEDGSPDYMYTLRLDLKSNPSIKP